MTAGPGHADGRREIQLAAVVRLSGVDDLRGAPHPGDPGDDGGDYLRGAASGGQLVYLATRADVNANVEQLGTAREAELAEENERRLDARRARTATV